MGERIMKLRADIKPKVMISRCLGFDSCRYDGQTMPFELLEVMREEIDFITICPEADIGLGTPRDSLRLIKEGDEVKLVQTKSKKYLTTQMEHHAKEVLDCYQDVDGFILKGRSPTCGIKDVKIYSGIEKAPVIEKGVGIFAKEVERRYPHLPMEDEGRLTNLRIREHFFTKLYAMFHFKHIAKNKFISDLNEFHARNKYLYFAYDQVQKNKLGIIIANYNKTNMNQVLDDYFVEMAELFSDIPTKKNYINAFKHILGFFSKEIGKEEKAFILDLIEKYKNDKIEKSSIASVLKLYAIKYNKEYLLQQTIFDPFPEKLLLLSNSAKVS